MTAPDPRDAALDEHLAELGQRTALLRPRPGFSERVLRAVEQRREAGGLALELVRVARRLVPVALAAALAAMLAAAQSESSANQALAGADTGEELEW